MADDLQELSPEDADALGLTPLSDDDAGAMGLSRLQDEPGALTESQARARGLMPLTADEARDQGLEPLGEAESGPDTFWRKARHAVAPLIGSLPAMGAGIKLGGAAGAAIGGPAAPATGAVGAIAGGLAGAMGAGYAISSIQEWALKKLGLDDSEQRALNEEAHPYASFAGELVPSVLAFSPGKIGMAVSERLLGGALQGGLEAGQEYAHKGSIDPYKVAAATAFGGVFAAPNRLGRRGMELGERYVPGRPDLQPRPGAAQEKDDVQTGPPQRPSANTATEAAPPRDDLTTTGMPDNVIGVRSAREYPKEDVAPAAVRSQDPARPVPDDVAAALRTETPVTERPTPDTVRLTPSDAPPTRAELRQQRMREQIDADSAALSEAVRPRPPLREDPADIAVRDSQLARGVNERLAQQFEGEDFKPQSRFDEPTPVTERQAAPTRLPEVKPEAPVTATVTPDVATLGGTRARPKVVEQAIERAKAEKHEKIAKAFEIAEPAEAMQMATKYLRALANQSGEIKNTGQGGKPAEYASARIPAKVARVEELGVTARSKADAERKSGAIKAIRQAFKDFPPENDKVPTSKEEIAALKDRLSNAIRRATGLYGDKDPLSYRPRVRPAEWMWLRGAKHIVDAKRLTPRKIAEFVALEKQLRSGNPEDVANVRATGRIEGDIAMSRRGGDEAILAAENEQAQLEPLTESGPGGMPSQRELYEGKAAQEFPGEPVPAEDVAALNPEPVTEPSAIKEPTQKTIDLTTASDAELEALAAQKPGENWKELEAKREQEKADKLKRLRELRAKGGRPPVTEVLSALKGDESGAGIVPDWLANMFNQQAQVATARAVNNTLQQVPRAKTLKVWGTDAIARYSDTIFNGRANNPIRKYHEANERAAVRARDTIEKDGQLVDEAVQMMDKYRGQRWDDFVHLVYDESYYKVYGDRPTTRKDQGFRVTDWARAHHQDLEARWRALPDELKDLRDKWHQYAADVQEKLTQSLGENKLYKLLGMRDPALVKRIIDEAETPQDVQTFGEDLIEAVRKHAKATILDGPYVPMRRFGKYVVTGKYAVPTPSSFLRRVNDNTFEFDSRSDVQNYVESLDLQPTVRSYFVDAQGNRTYTANGKEYRYHKDDPGVTQRWEVEVQDNHVEFVDKYSEAQTRRQEILQAGGIKPDSMDIQPKRYRPKANAIALAEDLGMNTLRGNKHFQSLPPSTQNLVRQAMAEEYLMAMAATRSGSSRVHRSNVPGYDTDFVRAISHYVQETGHKRAQLEFRPLMDEALEKAEEMVSPGTDTKFSSARRAVLNEVKSRDENMLNANYDMNASVTGRALHRVLALSQAARLMSPGYSIRNSTQPVTIAAPVLHGHFGAAGVDALGKVYGEIGTLKTIKTGLQETVRAAKGDTKAATILDDVKGRLPDQFSKDAVDYFREIGAVDGDAGFMVHKYAASRDGVKLDIGKAPNRVVELAEKALTKADQGIEWLDEVGRQLPRAVETVNRITVGVAAARMEYARNGGNRDAAFQFGKDVIDQTQFRYSETNRANWEKTNLARLPMQFKQFGRGTYALIGHNLGRAIRNADPGDRAAALKTLAGVAATTTAFAGLLGLPTEPFRMLLLGAKAAGLTAAEWDDVELKVREFTHAIAGKSGGEALAKGLPRLLNIDLSTGLGMDSLIFFGSPRAGTDREFDDKLYSWVGQLLVGAPGTLVGQALRGLREISTGQYMRGAQNIIPIKVAADTVRAVRQSREGVKTPSGRQISGPYSPYEAGLRTMGLPPGREAEENFHRRINVSHDFQERDRRGRLINAWLNAATSEQKTRAMRDAVQGGVMPRDLTEAYRSRLRQENRQVGATVPTRRNRDFAVRSRDVLNLPTERPRRPVN